MQTIAVFTIGHSNLSIEGMVKLLKAHRIQIVVDVRSMPYSRFPQFNKESLIQSLRESGIKYIYGGAGLGGRIGDPTCYKDRVIPERKTNIAELVDYCELTKRDGFCQGIERLADISGKFRTVIMCSEENPARCHRHLLIARRLLELGMDVYHIRGDGRLETAVIQRSQDMIQQKLF